MTYSVKIADITDPVIDLALRNLIKTAYNYEVLLPANFLAENTNSLASKSSFFLVAVEHSIIVGCNGFIANDFLLDGKNYTGYQSCWSVTHPAHQGKNIFTNLINEAKRMLKAEGAGFLYGIANNRSNPIITNKLGFVETPALRLRIPNLPFIKRCYVSKTNLPGVEQACKIDEVQVFEHKLMQNPSDVKMVKYKESWLWGKLILKKKYGINWRVFYVGGIHLVDKNDLNYLIPLIFKLHKISFVQFISCRSNSYNPLFKGWKKPNMNGFIYFNLNMPEFKHFDLMIGALDIF